MCVEPSGTAKDMRVYIVEALDHYPAAPIYYRNCVRQGKVIQVISGVPGECTTLDTSLVLDSASMANRENLRIVAFSQEPNSSAPAEVYQATEMSVVPFHVDGFEAGDFSWWSATTN